MKRRGFLGTLLAGCALPWRGVTHVHAWERDVMADLLVCECGAFIDGEQIDDGRVVAIDREAGSLTMSNGDAWRSSFSADDYVFIGGCRYRGPATIDLAGWVP